jgi:hypothetical protein
MICKGLKAEALECGKWGDSCYILYDAGRTSTRFCTFIYSYKNKKS